MRQIKSSVFRLAALVILFISATVAFAQNGDKFFIDGQKLQQEMTISSQNAAIKKFQAAKVLYKTADKQKMCDNQISICKSNIRTLRAGKKPTPTPKVVETPKFSLSQKELEFDGENGGSANVAVEAETVNWSFNVPDGVDGLESFAKATRSNDAKSINISVGANPKTLVREQVINVNYGDKKEVINIKQGGKPVKLSTSNNMLEFKAKGGNETIEIYTNSDSIITSNNNLTWYIESKPDWIETSVEVKKKKGFFQKVAGAVKGVVSGTAEDALAEDTKTSSLKIIAKAISKSDPAFSKGREGEIVFASQDKRHKITVKQL